MAKDKLTDYDSTASGNLDVGGVSVAEGMLPSGVNNAIRELMSHQADAFGAGTPMYVDQTNNRVGVGTASPQNLVQIEGSSGTAPSQLRLGVTSGGQYYDVGRDYTDGLMTFYSGQAVPYTGYKFSVNAGSEKIRIDNDGLKFNGDTAAANALDDYEQGNWTATVAGESGSITSYSVLSSTYTKVGDTVYVFCRFQVTDKGTGSNFVVSGLPFSSARELLGIWAGTNTTGVTGFMFTAGTGATSFTARRSSNWGDQCLFNETYTVQAHYRV